MTQLRQMSALKRVSLQTETEVVMYSIRQREESVLFESEAAEAVKCPTTSVVLRCIWGHVPILCFVDLVVLLLMCLE